MRTVINSRLVLETPAFLRCQSLHCRSASMALIAMVCCSLNITEYGCNFIAIVTGVPTTFNTRLSTSTTIASYPFELGEAADLRAELSSDFLTGKWKQWFVLSPLVYHQTKANMLLAVYHVADSLGTLAHIANGRNNYNHNTLRLLLAPGK